MSEVGQKRTSAPRKRDVGSAPDSGHATTATACPKSANCCR